MADDCANHAGSHNAFRRRNLDSIMTNLPANQSGAGRHKCPYCAYEQGVTAGLRQAADSLRALLLREAEEFTSRSGNG